MVHRPRRIHTGGNLVIDAQPKRRRFLPHFLLLACTLIAGVNLDATEKADRALLEKALAGFSTEPPRGWAYTMTTTRDGHTTVERFDPAKFGAEQWTLITKDGAAATQEELQQYRRHKAAVAPTGIKASFARGDVDTATARCVRETEREAEYACEFRADAADELLSRAALTLVVDKANTSIASFRFTLREPFSPALGVKMLELELQNTYAPKAEQLPVLPRTASSRFKGRVLFLKSVEETVNVSYSDFSPPAPRR
jgi:hypothetical protein